MKTINSKFKKLLTFVLTFAMLLFASQTLFHIFSSKKVAYAVSSNILEVKLDNPNFVPSGSQSSYPIEPADYTLVNADFTEISDSENVNAENIGVIKRDEDEFKSLYPYSNPNNASEEYMLVIDSPASAHVGYVMDNAIAMSSNSNYMLTVDVFTNANGIAELYLVDSDNDNEILSSILFAGKANSWTTYTFVVKTNDNSSSNIKLAMFHNGAGAVLFDNLSAHQLNDSALSSVASDAVELDLNDQVITSYEMTSKNNYLFREGGSNLENSSYSYVLSDDKEAFDGTNEFAFRAENINKCSSLYTSSNDFLSLEQNRVYKISVKAKVIDLDGKITLSLIATNSDGDIASEDLADENPTITISSNTSSELMNNYSTFTFYVLSNPTEISNYRLSINFGGEDGAVGKLYISNVTVSYTNYSTFSNATGDNVASADLSSSTAITSDNVDEEGNTYLINGNFNSVEVEDYSKAYPITPSGWEVSSGNYQQYYGVVNTDSTEWAKWASSDYTNLINPNSPSGSFNNNILMLYNATNDTLSYTSTAKTLAVESNYRFTINIKTQNAPATISLVTTLKEKEVVLASTSVDTNFEWKTVELNLKTAYQALDVSLKITLNTSKGYGYLYADNALVNVSKNTVVADYSTSADLHDFYANNGKGDFATPNFISGESKDGVIYGIVNTNNINNNNIISSADAEQRTKFLSIGENKNILAIRSTDTTHYTVNSTIGFDLSTDKYYSISIKVFTYNHLNQTADKLDNLTASLSISGFDGGFTNITTASLNSDNTINNGWKTYTFYINPTSDVTNANIQFSLGSASNECAGTVFFTDIEFKDDLTDFNSVSEDEYNKILAQSSNSDENEDTESEEEPTNNLGNINWGYVLPTILFSLAIVIAVVGVCVRKIKWKKPVKKSKNEYDRNLTVNRQVYLRKATAIKESKLRELNKQLTNLTTQRSEYEAKYKKDLANLRDLKIKRADKSDINSVEKELKKNQRLVASIGVDISKVETEINYVKTDAYINSLIKKLSTDKTSTQQNETNENSEEKTNK